MIKLSAYGRVRDVAEPASAVSVGRGGHWSSGGEEDVPCWVMVIDCAHDQRGYAEPIAVTVEIPESEHVLLAAAREIVAGEDVWVEGSGRLHRADWEGEDDPGPEVWIRAMGIHGDPDASLRNERVIEGTIHGVIASDPEMATRQRRDGTQEKVCRFRIHAISPEMPRGIAATFDAKIIGEDAGFFAHRHRRGDRVNVEGAVLESRWTSGGERRRKFAINVRRWTWAKDPPRQNTPAPSVTTGPRREPVVVRRRRS